MKDGLAMSAEQGSKQHSALLETLNSQEHKFGRRDVIFADINNTTERKGHSNAELYANLRANLLPLVNVTSLSLFEVVDLINRGIIQTPHALALKNGTRVFSADPRVFDKPKEAVGADDFSEDPVYKSQVVAGGFNKLAYLDDAPRKLFPLIQSAILGSKADFSKEDSVANRDKVGLVDDPYQLVCDLLLPGTTSLEQVTGLLGSIRTAYGDNSVFMMRNGVDAATQELKYGLHVLPGGFGKHSPIKYLYDFANATGGLFAGDSENDAAAMFGDYGSFDKNIFRVAVGGSSQGLLKQIETFPSISEKRSWKRLDLNGREVLVYVEPTNLMGPESFNRAVTQAVRLTRSAKE